MDWALPVESLSVVTLPNLNQKTPQRIPQVVETLAKDPNFIKVEFHIGRYITVVVNIEVERADIEVLKSDLDSASIRINVSKFLLCFTLPLFPQF
jgi:hypothetical protein